MLGSVMHKSGVGISITPDSYFITVICFVVKSWEWHMKSVVSSSSGFHGAHSSLTFNLNDDMLSGPLSSMSCCFCVYGSLVLCVFALGLCCGSLKDDKILMKMGLGLVLVGHVNFLLGALVHGAVLRHISVFTWNRKLVYPISNVIALVAGLMVCLSSKL